MMNIHGEVQTEKTSSKSTLKNGKFEMPKFQAALKPRQENLKTHLTV